MPAYRPAATRLRVSAAACAVLVVLSVLSGLLVLAGLAATPAQAAGPRFRFWTYWAATGSSWTYASTGPATSHPVDGSVQGWRYEVAADGAARAPRAAASFGRLCSGTAAKAGEIRVGIVFDYGTAVDARSGQHPPAARGACAQAAPGADAVALLAAVATIRFRADGLICAFDGYPSSGCVDIVGAAAPTHSPTPTRGPTPTRRPTARPTAAPVPSSPSPPRPPPNSPAPGSPPPNPSRTHRPDATPSPTPVTTSASAAPPSSARRPPTRQPTPPPHDAVRSGTGTPTPAHPTPAHPTPAHPSAAGPSTARTSPPSPSASRPPASGGSAAAGNAGSAAALILTGDRRPGSGPRSGFAAAAAGAALIVALAGGAAVIVLRRRRSSSP